MLIAALTLLVIALVLDWFVPRKQPGRRVLRALTASAIALSLVFLALLVFARPAMCDVLGGTWRSEPGSCVNEWGGNGDNSQYR